MSRAPIGDAKNKAVPPSQENTALQNTSLNYAPLANLVQRNIDGQRMASMFFEGIQSHYADPDTLYLAIKALIPWTNDIEALATLRGFCRVIQKRAEASHG